MTSNHITINIGAKYTKKKQNNTIVYTKLRSYITYITLTSYDIVNDT